MICHKRKIIFIHQPRTAGTSIEYFFMGKDWFDIEPNTKHLISDVAKYVYAKYWDDYVKFTVLRNQESWMRSLFESHGRGNGGVAPTNLLQPHPCGAEPMSFEEFKENPRFILHEFGFTGDQDSNTHGLDVYLQFEKLETDWGKFLNLIKVDYAPLGRW